MASDQTKNFGFNLWHSTDSFMREEFNRDNEKTEQALTEVKKRAEEGCRMAFGTYTGDGAESRTIVLGFAPKAVDLTTFFGMNYLSSSTYGGTLLEGAPLRNSDGTVAEVTEDGFRVYYGGERYANKNKTVYHYIAWS